MILQNLTSALQNWRNDDAEDALDYLQQSLDIIADASEDCVEASSVSMDEFKSYVQQLMNNPWILANNVEANQFAIVQDLQQAYIAYENRNFTDVGANLAKVSELIFEINH